MVTMVTLKTQAIIAVLLGILPFSQPVPGQSAKPAAQRSYDAGQQPDNHQDPPASPVAVDGEKQAGPAEKHSGPVGGEDKQQKITVVSLPPVSVAKEKKGFWGYVFDWGPWLFNLGLLVVGGLQVWLLLRTWKAIERQADLLKKQTEAAARSTESFINKERSRMFVSADITPDFEVTVRAANRGLSPARITYKYVGSELYRPTESFVPEIPRDTDPGEPAEDNVRDEWVVPGKSTEVGDCDNSFISQSENPELYAEIMSGEMIVWYYGIIRWIDSVSEDDHWIRFCYRCHPRRDGHHRLAEGGPAAYRGEK
jgi:hypothetical protein